MFGLFKKKEANTPEERLAECEKKKDWAGLAKAYYELGAAAMEAGELNKARLWLHRADTVFSANDGVYEKVGGRIVDDCSERIGKLEEGESLYNDIPVRIEESVQKELSGPQVRVWGLLSAARLVRLGERLGALPGCEVLGELGWAVDMMLRSLQKPPAQEDHQKLMDVCNRLYELGDSPAFYAGGAIDVPGGAPFQVFDLNGMMGVHLELNSYIDSHLRLIAALSQGAEELPAAESGIVACALLPDYYVRTGGGRLEEAPPLQAELERIWSDFDFVCGRLTWDEVGRRIEGYKQLDILAK